MDDTEDQGQGSTGEVAQQQEAAEKLLRQSEVNELIGKAKHAAYEKGKREAAQAQPPQGSQGTMGGMPQVTDDHIRAMIADEAQKQTHLAAAHSMLQNFAGQMQAGKAKYPDFDDAVSNLGNLQNIPHVVQMATDTGMSGDIMYELGKNPSKVATLTTLSYVNPHLAKIEMQKLAESIQKNEAAAKAPSADDPLSQVTPSTVGTDNGSRGVKDFKSMPYLRG